MPILLLIIIIFLFIIYRWGSNAVDRDESFLNSENWEPNAIRLKKTVGGFVDVVGEASYQKALKYIYNLIKSDTKRPIASLIPEDSNEYDKNAIQIKIGKHTVGYLSRANAKVFRKTHSAAIKEQRIIQCSSKLVGNPSKNIGVLLDFDLEHEDRYK